MKGLSFPFFLIPARNHTHTHKQLSVCLIFLLVTLRVTCVIGLVTLLHYEAQQHCPHSLSGPNFRWIQRNNAVSFSQTHPADRAPNKGSLIRTCVKLLLWSLGEIKAFSIVHFFPPGHLGGVFFFFFKSLCQSCASEWGTEQAKTLLFGFCWTWKKTESKEEENVAFLAAFFPSSGIHWGLAVCFLREPFPVLLGITGLLVPAHFELRSRGLSLRSVQVLRTTTHPRLNPLNIQYHTGTKWPLLPVSDADSLKSSALIFSENNTPRSTAGSGSGWRS